MILRTLQELLDSYRRGEQLRADIHRQIAKEKGLTNEEKLLDQQDVPEAEADQGKER